MPNAITVAPRPPEVAAARPHPAGGLVRAAVRRHAWWVEAGIVVTFYLLYASTRALAPGTRAQAEANARRVMTLERHTGLDPERWLNRALAPIDWLSTLTGYYYLTLHFAVTVAVLAWTHARRPQLYAWARTSLALASATALLAFWFLPVAPPRLADPGVRDVVVEHDVFGAAGAQQGHSPLENVYAAMPSLHVGWALWVALVARRASRSAAGRRAAWCYPVATTLVVLATGNHYLVDAIAGAALVLAAEATVRRCGGTPSGPARRSALIGASMESDRPHVIVVASRGRGPESEIRSGSRDGDAQLRRPVAWHRSDGGRRSARTGWYGRAGERASLGGGR